MPHKRSTKHFTTSPRLTDAQIAAICRCRDATLATRNVKDFAYTGVSVLDPWR